MYRWREGNSMVEIGKNGQLASDKILSVNLPDLRREIAQKFV